MGSFEFGIELFGSPQHCRCEKCTMPTLARKTPRADNIKANTDRQDTYSTSHALVLFE